MCTFVGAPSKTFCFELVRGESYKPTPDRSHTLFNTNLKLLTESLFKVCNPVTMLKPAHTSTDALTLVAAALCLLYNPMSQADAAKCFVSSTVGQGTQSDTAIPSCSTLYPDYLYDNKPSPWKIGFGAGVGERTNPLVSSDDIPIYGIIQLSYFGDRFFFDNGDIGWYLHEEKKWSFNAIAGVGGERSFFSFLNTSSIGFNPATEVSEPGSGLDNPPPEPGNDDIPLAQEKLEIPDRDYTVDGGIEYLYRWNNSDLQVQLLTDISGRHNGQEIWVSWTVPQRFGRWSFLPSVGLNWKSADTANYYYGVKDKESSSVLSAYEVDSATSVFGRLALSYSINAHWKVVSVIQYEKLANEITDSPIVKDDYVRTGFLGLYYEF